MAAKKRKLPALRLPRLNIKVVAVAVLAAAVVVGAWMLFSGPARDKAAAASSSARTAQDSLAATKTKIADIRSGKKTSADALLTQAQTLDVLLPAQADKIDLVTKIPTLAAMHHVIITRMDPVSGLATPGTGAAAGAASASAPVAAQAFSMGATGAVSDLTSWMAALANYPALVGTSEVTMSLTPAPTTGTGSVPMTPSTPGGTIAAGADTVTFTLKAFYLPAPTIKTH